MPEQENTSGVQVPCVSLLDAAMAFRNAAFVYLNACDNGGVCSDRSCLRCRIADAAFEIEQKHGILPMPANGAVSTSPPTGRKKAMTREDREAFDDLDDDEKLKAYEIAVDDLAAVRRSSVAAYEQFKHLDDLFERIDDPLDPFHAAARELWRAVKESMGVNACLDRPAASAGTVGGVVPPSIINVSMLCPSCGWSGPVGDCEPDVDGEGSLGCPKCNSACGQNK
jgi:hypothetical protein